MNDKVQWMVFKVKQKAATNYFTKTADSKDDARFKFNFEIGSSGAERESVPDYSYNWPFDFCSLVELVKLDSTLIMGNPDFATPPPILDAAQGTIGPLITWNPTPEANVGAEAKTAADYLLQVSKTFGALSQQDLEIAKALAQAAPNSTPTITQGVAQLPTQTTSQQTTNTAANMSAPAAYSAPQTGQSSAKSDPSTGGGNYGY